VLISRVTLPLKEDPIMQVQNESDRNTALSTKLLRRHQMPTPLEKYRPFNVIVEAMSEWITEGVIE
jgi:hypothetical protein